jgi:thiamine biosynthesis lipoprotein ApbE
VTVIAASGTIADALSTTLLLMPVEEGKQLLRAFPDASAWWLSAAGTVVASQQSRRHPAGTH